MKTANDLAKRDHDRYRQQCDALEIDLAIAVRKDRDEIARMLIKKLKPLENLRAGLNRQATTMDEEIARLKNFLDQQRICYDQIKHRSAEYFRKTQMCRQETGLSEPIPDGFQREFTENDLEIELLRRKEALGK